MFLGKTFKKLTANEAKTSFAYDENSAITVKLFEKYKTSIIVIKILMVNATSNLRKLALFLTAIPLPAVNKKYHSIRISFPEL